MRIKYQLVPLRCHVRNAVERSIQSYKNHMISALCTVDPRFSLTLWCCLLPSIDLTLDLLQKLNLHPQLSAQTALYGEFKYNATPIVPLGTKARVYDPPSIRKSWVRTPLIDGMWDRVLITIASIVYTYSNLNKNVIVVPLNFFHTTLKYLSHHPLIGLQWLLKN